MFVCYLGMFFHFRRYAEFIAQKKVPFGKLASWATSKLEEMRSQDEVDEESPGGVESDTDVDFDVAAKQTSATSSVSSSRPP